MGMHQMLGPSFGASDPDPVDVTRSLRFNSGDSAYLSRTPSSVGNRRTWTYSCWVKRTTIGGVYPRMFGNYHGGGYQGWDINFMNNDKIDIHYDSGSGNYIFRRTTTQVFRDPSAWYHIVVAVDTTDATANDRVKLYVNGEQVSAFDTNTNAAQNTDTNINTAVEHRIGYNYTYSDFYLANVEFIDGQALLPTKFGEFNDDGIWGPVEYSGSYGTNGFYLKFANNSTNAALGTDSSGNSNTWTVNNLTASALGTGTVSGAGTPANASGSGGWAQAFDGSTSTLVYNSNGSTTTTFTLTDSIAWTSKIRIYAGQNGTSGTNISANGVNLSALVTWPLSGGWQEVTTHLSSPLTSLALTSVGGQSSNIRAVEIDNTVIVQGDAKNIDVLFDSPTNLSQSDTGAGGQVSGNYATWSPLVAQSSGSITLSNGNLDTTCGTTRTTAMSSFPLTGKTYWEVTFGSGTYNYIGMTEATGFNTVANNNSGIKYTGYQSYSYGWQQTDGKLYKASNIIASPGSYSNGDVLGWAYDADNNTLKLYKNGSLVHTENNIADAQYFPAITHSGTATASTNFGQRSFAFAAPSNYKPVSTATSLPTPTIADGSDYFDTKLYNGNGGTNAITGFGFSPDFVWLKRRNLAKDHSLFDTVRGIYLQLFTNNTNAEASKNTSLTSFDSNGFTLGLSNRQNENGYTNVAWAWDAGSSTVSNTDGSITSSVRANPSAGFSIVGYTGNNTQGATIGHGLNAVPDFVIIKNRSYSEAWDIYHQEVGYGKVMRFSTATPATASDVFPSSHSSSVIKVGSSRSQNGNSEYMIAYCFTPVAGYSAFGSYTGNGSSDGTFVYTGFRPALVLQKRSDSSGDQWTIHDSTREPGNDVGLYLEPSTSNAEQDGNRRDFLSNGFKLRTSSGGVNASGGTYVYAAFAEHPFKTARAY